MSKVTIIAELEVVDPLTKEATEDFADHLQQLLRNALSPVGFNVTIFPEDSDTYWLRQAPTELQMERVEQARLKRTLGDTALRDPARE
jgi:hypothetical protein